MGFNTEKIPYSLSLGLDLSKYNDLIVLNSRGNLLPDLITKMSEIKLDYLVSNVSFKDAQLRNSNLKTFTTPMFVDDYALFSYEWKNKFIGQLHNEDLTNISENMELIMADLDYINHISSKNIMINYNSINKEGMFLFIKMIKKFLIDNPDRLVNFIIPFTKIGLSNWNKFYSEIGHLENAGLVIEMEPDLPEENILSEFATHNLKSLILPFSIFVTNKNGYPVLSKLHQDYIKFLLGFKIDVIFMDDCEYLIQYAQSNGNYNLENFEKIKDYYLYICHLFVTHRDFKNIDYVLFNYLDVFQIPLQPLRDNLPSQTYECFEEDVTKYDYYELAIDKALENFKLKGFLNINKINEVEKSKGMLIENNSNELNNGNKRVITVCVLGGGRGPLVRRVISAVMNNKMIINKDINVYCVEKNRNAFNTLLNLQIKEPEVFGGVKFIFSDMRDFKPDFKIDIVVSELLGSFGDNELSPECLYDIQSYLSDDSIMIPHSYTSFLRPVTCPITWASVKKIIFFVQ